MQAVSIVNIKIYPPLLNEQDRNSSVCLVTQANTFLTSLRQLVNQKHL